MNDWEKGFTCGYACACAMAARNGGMPPDELWRSSNMDDADLAIVEPRDAEAIRAALNGDW